jgi:hypothetical protein
MKLTLFQKKVVAFILLISCINLFMGCHRYFRPVVVNTATAETKQTTLKKLSDEHRYFILRRGIYSYALSNVILDQSKMTLTANVGGIPAEHQLYLNREKKSAYAYSKGKNEDVVLNEVHIFTGDISPVDNESVPYTFSLSDVQKIELIEFDKKKTTSHHIWGTIGIVLGAPLVVAIIAAATYKKPAPSSTGTISSCPYISTFDGQGYKLQGEIYSAAIYPSLQRDDYLPLQTMLVKGDYRIKISNELQEIQHTDFADLMVVEHNKDVKVFIGPGGKIYSVSRPQLPVKAILNNTDVTEDIKYKDNNSCFFKDENGTRPSEDLFISFKNDSKSKQGKLILSTKTSSWLNYLYGEFTKGFGSHYNEWAKEQENRPAAELEKWADDQNIPLTVSVKTANGWKEIQKIKAIGPLINRDIVIPADLPAGETAEFKISGGYMFWELDYAAIDYTSNTDFKVQTIKPYEAINEKGADVLADIISPDKKYLIQPDVGDSTILKYKNVAVKEGMTQTFFLHASGYYKYIRDYKGTPKAAFLKSFNQPGALVVFSRQKFSEVWNNIAAAKK